jgi:hypothetical protein
VPAPQPLAQPVVASLAQPAALPHTSFVAPDAVVANAALVPAASDGDAAVRYAATRRDEDVPLSTVWLLLVAAVTLSGLAVGLRRRHEPALAWGTHG